MLSEHRREPIGTRWVDVNPGDESNPGYRSRLVAQELNTHTSEKICSRQHRRWRRRSFGFSPAVTEGIGFQQDCRSSGHSLDFIDIRRAYFHAPARRLVYVNPPPADREPGMCGRLRKALYGSRDAAQNWEYAYVDFLIEQGVASGLATPCIFYKVRDLRIVVTARLVQTVHFTTIRGQVHRAFETQSR